MIGLKEVTQYIKENDNFVIVPDYDCDGTCAAAICALMLEREGKNYEIYQIKRIDEDHIKELREQGDNFIFLDMGSSSYEILEKGLQGKTFLIFDHHEPDKKGHDLHFNPHFSGIDGSTELCGASTTYLVAREINENNKDLAKIAVVGMIGDIQDKTGKVIGKNREVLQDAIDSGELEVKKDLRLYGRYSRPLIQFLSYCADPYLPDLTGNQVNCLRFLQELKIPLKEEEKWRTYSDLTEDEKKRFISSIYIYGKHHGVSENVLKNLVGETYEFKKETHSSIKDVKEYSTIMNACSRHGEQITAIKVCMGDREEHFEKALQLLRNHMKMISQGISYANEKGVKELSHSYVLDCRGHVKDTIVGIVAGILYGAGEIKRTKPILALANDDEGYIKISGRGTSELISKGLHLGEIMKVADHLGGLGGGHDIAAGAKVLPENVDKFLEQANEKIGEQLNQS